MKRLSCEATVTSYFINMVTLRTSEVAGN